MARIDAWWEKPKDEAHAEVFGRVQYLAEQNHELRQDNILYLNIQSNFNVDGSGSYGPLYWQTAQRKIRRNIAAAICDTAASMIAANRTIPSYQTSKGKFSIARKAEQRARVIHAQMWREKAFDLGVEAFYDAACVGSGITHGYVCPEAGRPKLCRVEPNSLFVDAAEGRNPRSVYWVHFVAREVLKAQYPDAKYDLDDAGGPTSVDHEEFCIRDDNTADLVKVIEAWHLSPGGKRGKGRHVITVSNVTLWDEPYSRQRFPFAFHHYAHRRGRTFWGQGLVERTLPAQLQICELQETLDQCLRMTGPVYLVEENSNVHEHEISNELGKVYSYQGTPPQMVVWDGVPASVVSQIREIAQDVYEQEGLAPGVVGGELPQKGLNSARAVRAADDVSSRRLVLPTRNLESYYLQVAQLLEDLNDDCAELDPQYAVTGFTSSGRRNFLTTSKWKELEIPEGDATLTVMSMSAVPTTPQARIAALEEYIQAGFMGKAHAIQHMELGGDTGTWAALETSNVDLVEWQIERMLDGEMELPIPQQDLTLAADLVTKAYLVAYRMEAEPEVLEAMEKYLAYAKQQLEESAPEPETMPEEMAPVAMDPSASRAAYANIAAARQDNGQEPMPMGQVA
jgi:hypothetical protein